jgi:2-polyprenyl-3-methyl-5-hydroxy-6-metoxy-1,4-benzoquinol methylase
MLTQKLMRLWPAKPPSPNDLSLNEIFNHDVYCRASSERQAEIRCASSQFRYNQEREKLFWETYFPTGVYLVSLVGCHVLDFGCFTGGRGVLWAQEFKTARIYGCDINPVYIQAANEFAELHGVRHEYRVIEEGLIPFRKGTFDTVVSFDVLEHVDDVQRCMKEIHRVLKPGGKAYLVFPQFYQPFESHLGFVTNMPGLQCLIPARTLTRAFVREIESHQDPYWYKPHTAQAWEKLPYMNGVTQKSFQKILADMDFEIEWQSRTPILSHGKSFQTLRTFVVRPLLKLMLTTRLFDEILLDRIAVILQKPHGPI